MRKLLVKLLVTLTKKPIIPPKVPAGYDDYSHKPYAELPEIPNIQKQAVQAFVLDMLKELRANQYKGDWKDATLDDLLFGLYDHLLKLHLSISRHRLNEIREYSADVANMAMMISDVSRERKYK